MSDQKSGSREDRHSRRSETLERWESEGGRVRWLSSRSPSASRHAGGAEHSESEIALLDTLPVGILITNVDGEIAYSNPAFQKLYAAPASELLGTHWCEVIDSRDRAAVPARWPESADGHHPMTFEARMVARSGRIIWTRHNLTPDRATGGRIHVIEDITAVKTSEQAAKAANEALSRERERARVTLESIGDAVISTDAAGRVTYLNAVAEDLTGWSREDAFGKPFDRVFRVIDTDTGQARNPADRAMKCLDIVEIPANCLLQRRDGSELAIEDSAAPIYDAEGRLTGAAVIFRDRKLSRENTARMAHLARHDALTDLPNRVSFAEHFEQAINFARRHHKQVGLLFVDLDNFKQVNDSLGHRAGDRLLKELSRKLTSCLRNTDMACRYGGDEFVVLLSELNRPEDARRVAAKIRSEAARAVQVRGYPVGLELSIGISLYPEDGADLDTMVHKADVAMYHAKLSSYGYCFYQVGMERPISSTRHEAASNAIQRSNGHGNGHSSLSGR